MKCNPTPESACGNTLSDACVTISDPNIFQGCPGWISELPDLSCGRQSELNAFFALAICDTARDLGQEPDCDDPSVATGIHGSIGLACLTPCDPDLGAPFKPLGTGNPDARVNDEIQNVYVALCDLKTTLNTWYDLPLPQNFDLSCIGDKCCDVPPNTLGTLLEALVAKVCCIVNNAVDSEGIVLNNAQSGACPNCVT